MFLLIMFSFNLQYLSDTETTLEGTHETPVKHYIDDLKFTFQANGVGSCNVQVS